MEQKKKIKISLTNAVLIIAIIVIGIMVYVMYQMNEKINEFSKQNSQNQSNTMSEDKLNNEILNDENNSEVKESVLSNSEAEKMAKEAIEQYFKLSIYEDSSIGPAPYILAKLELSTEKELDSLCEGVSDTSKYIQSNVKYEDFKSAMLQYITEEYFLEKFSQYKNMNGYVGFCNCGGGYSTGKIKTVKLLSANDKKFEFDIDFIDTIAYEFALEDDKNIPEDNFVYTLKCEFEYINEKLLISKLWHEESKDSIEDECKRVFENHYEIEQGMRSTGKNLNVLKQLGLVSSTVEIEKYETIKDGNTTYYSTDIKYEDFKSQMLKYVSDKYFKEHYEEYYIKNIDGYLQLNVAETAKTTFDIKEYNLGNKEGDLYILNLKGETITEDGNSVQDAIEIKVSLELKNTNFVISNIEYLGQ